jgi:ATP-dependent exoDNAse (exonuclease V) beta subunit
MALPVRLKADAMLVPRTKDGKEKVHWRKALDALRNVHEETPLFQWMDESSLMKKVAAGETKFDRVDIPEDVLELLRGIEAYACEVAEKLYADQCLALRILRAAYAPGRDAAARAAASVTFAEVEAFVRKAALEDGNFDWEDLYFVLDGRVQHVLFDEFQDTSASQFEFFEPIFEEAGSTAGRSVFVVGDPKQAIYGWRGGDREVIDQFPARFHVTPEAMNDSWRSSPVVLSAVDRVFESLRDCEASQGEPNFCQAAALWLGEPGSSGGYQRHIAKKAGLRGEVILRTMEDPVESVLEQVQQLRSMEDPPKEIGILLRSKKWIGQIVEALRTRGGVPDAVAGSDSGSLADSVAVEWILASLTFMDHPHRQSVAALLASHAPWAKELGDGTAMQDLEAWVRRMRGIWMKRGAFGLVDEWLHTECFQMRLPERDRVRCSEVRALAAAFDSEGGGRPDDLVERVRSARSAATFEGSVRVMTIHASKGLEFDAVILAEIELSRPGRSTVDFVRDADGRDFLVPASETFARRARVDALRNRAMVRRHMEELSLLYVAMTRARSFLHILVPKQAFNGTSRSGRLARTIAQALQPDGRGDTRFFREAIDGEPWKENAHAAPTLADAAFGERASSGTRGVDRRQFLRLEPKSPSQREGGGRISLRDLLRNTGRGMEVGSLVHEVLALINWLDDETPLRRLSGFDAVRTRFASSLGGSAVDEIVTGLEKRLGNPADELRRPFERNSYARRWKVPPDTLEAWRERSFAVAMEQSLWSGRFDRVVIARLPSGEVSHVEVVDFKSDLVRDEAQRAEKEAHYAPQLESYLGVLRQAFSRQVQKPEIETRLVFTNPEIGG